MNKKAYEEYEIIDSHAHIFPPKIAAKATENIGRFYDIPMKGEGSSERLLESGREIGVKKYLVCSSATSPDQVSHINTFIREECSKHPEFLGFGTLHPDMENIEQEIERIISMGLRGIKLHPDFQRFNIDSPAAYKMYELLENRLPILFHAGDNRYEYSKPHRIARVAKDFPVLSIIAAHLGGYRCWQEAETVLNGRDNVFFDCSSSASMLPPEYAKSLINGFGVTRVFFGCDFPMWKHKSEFDAFMNLGFSYEDNVKILSENFKTFIGGI